MCSIAVISLYCFYVDFAHHVFFRTSGFEGRPLGRAAPRPIVCRSPSFIVVYVCCCLFVAFIMFVVSAGARDAHRPLICTFQ